MSNILDALAMGPKNTMQPAPGAPSIYAGADEWARYRQTEAQRLAEQLLATKNTMEQTQDQAQYNAVNAAMIGSMVNDSTYTAPVGVPVLSPEESAIQPNASTVPQELLEQVAPTRKKNAKEDLINSSTSATGIKAFTDENGRIVLTNSASATDAKSAMSIGAFQQGTINNPATTAVNAQGEPVISMPEAPATMNSLLQKMRAASDFNEVSGIQATLLNSIAAEKTSRIQQATQFAEQKLGVSFLEKALADNMAMDRQYYPPGTGDSSFTANIRNQLNTARQQATIEAERYLAKDPTYASYAVTEKIAQDILAEKSRRQNTIDDVRARSQVGREVAAEAKNEERRRMVQAFTPEERDRIIALNPDIGNSDDPILAIADTIEVRGKDKEYMEAIKSSGDELIATAIRGNPYAQNLVLSKESQVMNTSQTETMRMIESVRARIDNPRELPKFLAEMFPKNPEERQRIETSIRPSPFGGGPEEKEAQNRQKAMLALQYMRMQATSRYLNDLSPLANLDPALADAISRAKTITKKPVASFDDVYTAYIGDAKGQEQIAKARALKKLLQAGATPYANSQFGMPQVGAIDELIDRRILSVMTVGGFMADVGNTMFGLVRNSPLPGTGMGNAFQGTQGNNLFSRVPEEQ